MPLQATEDHGFQKMNHHDAEIVRLKERLLIMAGLAETAVRNATKALNDRSDELAARVEADDRVLDTMEKEIDEVCLGLLTMAPLATELRAWWRISLTLEIRPCDLS